MLELDKAVFEDRGGDGRYANLSEKLKDAFVFPWLIIFIALLIALLPLLLADYIYMDDMGRVAHGYAAWDQSWRYLSDLLSFFLYSDSYLADISPFPQLLALAIVATALTISASTLCPTSDRKIAIVAAAVPLVLSPYFLQCLSYKYDAPYMALSVLFPILPFLFLKKSNRIFYLSIFLCGLGMCLTYQSSSGIFPMLLAMVLAKKWHEGQPLKKLLPKALIALLMHILALAFFQYVIAQPPRADSVDTGLPPLLEIPGTFTANLSQYYERVIEDARTSWVVLYALCLATFIISYIASSQRGRRLRGALVSISVIAFMLIACFGVYPFLKVPLFSPRGMLGFGALLSFVNLYSVYLISKPLLRGAIVLLACAFISFSMIYGNALESQKEYTRFRVEMVVDALNDEGLIPEDHERNLQVVGDIGVSPIIRNMPADYTALRRLIHPTFSGSYIWGRYYLLNYYGIQHYEDAADANFESMNLPIVRDTYYYTIRADDTNVLVVLKAGS